MRAILVATTHESDVRDPERAEIWSVLFATDPESESRVLESPLTTQESESMVALVVAIEPDRVLKFEITKPESVPKLVFVERIEPERISIVVMMPKTVPESESTFVCITDMFPERAFIIPERYPILALLEITDPERVSTCVSIELT